jgi:hypothetical protein
MADTLGAANRLGAMGARTRLAVRHGPSRRKLPACDRRASPHAARAEGQTSPLRRATFRQLRDSRPPDGRHRSAGAATLVTAGCVSDAKRLTCPQRRAPVEQRWHRLGLVRERVLAAGLLAAAELLAVEIWAGILERLVRQLRMSTPIALPLRRCVWIAPLLALAAGYLSARHVATASKVAAGVPESPMTFEYPTSWQPTSPPAQLAAIDLGHTVVVAPAAGARAGGLLAAAVGGQGEPLPATLLARLARRPQGEAIWLVSAPAFRYQGLSLAATDIQLTAYAIPVGDGHFTLAVCFASPREASVRRRCEQIVEGSNAPQQGSGPPIELQPQAGYAKTLGVVLRGLQKVRSQTRATMAESSSPATLADDARRLALAFADTQLALKTLSTPAVATHAQNALERSMLAAQHAYTALATAAEDGETSRYLVLRGRVQEAESDIRSTLAGFGLLGYRVA